MRQEEEVRRWEEERKTLWDIIQGNDSQKISKEVQGKRGRKLSSASSPPPLSASGQIYTFSRLLLVPSPRSPQFSFSGTFMESPFSPLVGLGGSGLELEGRPTMDQALCWDQIYDTSRSLHNDSLRQGSVSHFRGEEREARLEKEQSQNLSQVCLRSPAEMSPFPSAAS